MPFKSKAQRRKFAELLVEGKITDEAYERWNRETGGKELPERANPKGTKKRKRLTKKRATKRKSTKTKSTKTKSTKKKSATKR